MAYQKSKIKINFIKKEDSFFPNLLREMAGAPEGIYFLGELPKDDIPKVAIVGTRKATQAGRALAKKIALELTRKGILIVSGLAMGIDTAAHEGALSGQGKTLAVLANGLDSIYPVQNENLAEEILAKGGSIISEYAPGTPALPHQFLARNRIVSGLCLATIVIEAPRESGSLVTARLAAEQGREVFVFPGPVDHPNYYGSHELIRDGARLVTGADDILEDLGFSEISGYRKSEDIDFQNKEEELIFGTLKEAGQPLGIDKIIEITKLEPQAANRAIAFLSINNIIKETERGYTI